MEYIEQIESEPIEINDIFYNQELYDINSQDESDIEHENLIQKNINENNKPFHNNYMPLLNNFQDSPINVNDKQYDIQQLQDDTKVEQQEEQPFNSLSEFKIIEEQNPIIKIDTLIQQTQNESIIQSEFKKKISIIEHLGKENSDDDSSEDNNKIVEISADQRRFLVREERYKEMEKYIDRNVDKYDIESQDEQESIVVIQDNQKDKSECRKIEKVSTKRNYSDAKQRCSSNPRGTRVIQNVRNSVQKQDQHSLSRPINKNQNSNNAQVTRLKKKKKKLIFNTFYTQYPVIDLAAKNTGFQTIYKDHLLVPSAQLKAAYRIAPGIYANIPPEEFDVVWFDCPTREDVFQKLKPYQRISQIPGIQVLSSKARLARNLNLMIKQFPDEYNFFPKTFLLPQDIQDFKRTVTNQSQNKDVFIVKPSHQCQGRGIHLVKNWEDYQEEQNQRNGQVAQLYLDDPYLIDGLKFDLRIYVLIYGVHPLRIYIYNDGLARFATTPYESVQTGDIKNLFMHLTNYSINKNSQNYVQNENFDGGTGTTQDFHQTIKAHEGEEIFYGQTGGIGEQIQNKRLPHKRSLKQIINQIKEQSGVQSQKLEKDIEDLIIKTMITGQPHLYQTYKNLLPEDIENQQCFQILGFDVMIDSKLKPWLIEINQSPSFATDSAFDFRLKKKLMEDTFQLLNMSLERKSQYQQVQERSQYDRLMLNTKKNKPNFYEKEFQRYQIDLERDKIEHQILSDSGYKLIFPLKTQEPEIHQYVKFLRTSKEIQDYYINGKKTRVKEENFYDMLLKSQLTKRLERQSTLNQIKNIHIQNLQENFAKILKTSEKKNRISTIQTVEVLKKDQVKLVKPLQDEIQKDKQFKNKNLGKIVFQKQIDNEIETINQNDESQKKTMTAIKNIIGFPFEFSKNPYIISSKNQESINLKLKDQKITEIQNKIQQKHEALNQSPKQKNRPISTSIKQDQISKTPNKIQSKAQPQNNYQRLLIENRISLNQFRYGELIKEQKQKNVKAQKNNEQINYTEKKSSYKQVRVNKQINADLTSAIHSVDFTNQKRNFQKSTNSFVDLQSNKSCIREQNIQVYDLNEESKSSMRYYSDLEKPRKSSPASPTFNNQNEFQKSPFAISNSKHRNQETNKSMQIYSGYQKELERLQKIEKVLKKDAIIQKQGSDLNEDSLPYQYKTPQRIKKLYQNIEKQTPEIHSLNKSIQNIFSTVFKQQEKTERSQNYTNTQDDKKQQEERKRENDNKLSQQNTKRNIQSSQKVLKTLDNKLDLQIFNTKRKAQDIQDVQIQVIDTFRHKFDLKDDIKLQQKQPSAEEPSKIFKKIIETQKQNGCDPVFDIQKDFKFELQIGQGSFSNVKKMTHIQSGFKVAIKTYEKQQLRRKSQLMAIHREIYILAKMDHPNIMKLYEVVDSSTNVSLVLQLCKGIKLNDYLQKYGTKGRIGINNNITSYLSEPKSKYIFKQIVEAVNYMHIQGIAHRDLRIETIIINESNSKIKMVDFGFATSFDFKFQVSGQSNESQDDSQSQISSEIVKNRLQACMLQDCYNLGIILFILLTGGLPVWAQIESEIYQKIISPKNCLPISSTNNRVQDNFSKECQDLINNLFKCDQLNQINLQDVLKCEWLNKSKS